MVVDPLAKMLPLTLHTGNGIHRMAANPFTTGSMQADPPNVSPAASFSQALEQAEKQNSTACKRVSS